MLPTTSCKTYCSWLNDYIDDRISGRRSRALENHLNSCPTCRGELQELLKLKEALGRQSAPLATEAFWERCLRNVFTAPAPRRFFPAQVWKPAVVLILSVLVIGLIQWGPWAERPAALPVAGGELIQAEIPDSEYLLQHSEFAGSQPLSATSQYLLISARAAEKSKLREQMDYNSRDNEP